LHAPFASHVAAVAHESGSGPFAIGVQFPGSASAHVWHVPQLALSQHTPSTQ
jgi:hypothetical protein